MVYYFLSITLKKHSKPCLFILKALKDILHHFKFVNWRIRVFVFWCHEQVIGFLALQPGYMNHNSPLLLCFSRTCRCKRKNSRRSSLWKWISLAWRFVQFIKKTSTCIYAGLSPGGAPIFDRSVNPISTRGGGRLCPPYTGVHTKFWKPQARLDYLSTSML